MAISATVGAAAVGAAGSAYSAKKGAKAAKQGSTTTSEPWAEQVPYLQEAFKESQGIYQGQKDSPYFQGDLYAKLNGVQTGAIQGTQNWTGGMGQQLVNGASGAALSSMGNATMAGQNAQNFANGNFGVTSGANQGVVNGVNGTALGGMGQLGSAIGAANGALGMASGDPTQGNIDAAAKYADNPYLQGQIDAASNDAVTALGRNLVGLNNAASAGGNLNSSRTGAAEAVATQETADRIARTSADMRSAAYQNGLGLAEQARGTNIQGTLGAGNQFSGMVGQGIQAGGNSMSYGEDQRQFDTQARVNGNSQLLQSGQVGLDAAQVGNSMAMGNQNANLQAGGVLQADAQGSLDAALKQWQGQDTRATDLLARYMQTVGGQGWGSQGTSTQPYAGQGAALSGIQGAVGGAAAGYGLYNQFNPSQPQYNQSAPQFGGYTTQAQTGQINWS